MRAARGGGDGGVEEEDYADVWSSPLRSDVSAPSDGVGASGSGYHLFGSSSLAAAPPGIGANFSGEASNNVDAFDLTAATARRAAERDVAASVAAQTTGSARTHASDAATALNALKGDLLQRGRGRAPAAFEHIVPACFGAAAANGTMTPAQFGAALGSLGCDVSRYAPTLSAVHAAVAARDAVAAVPAVALAAGLTALFELKPFEAAEVLFNTCLSTKSVVHAAECFVSPALLGVAFEAVLSMRAFAAATLGER